VLVLLVACDAGGVRDGEGGPGPDRTLEAAMTSLSDAERREVEASVDSATRAFEDAERARDPERAIAHLAPEFYMYVDGVRSGYDSVVAGIRRALGTLQRFEPGFEDIEVVVLGRDAAVSTFTFHDAITTADGETQRFRGPTTLVWERRGANWLIVYADADHYVDSEEGEERTP
jgi:ketosteroid isomerase-like protein